MNGIDAFNVLKNKIEEFELIEYPYPHILITNVLPDEFYRRLLDNIPDVSEFEINKRYPGRGVDGKVNTLVFDDFKSEPWKSFADNICSKEFSDLLLVKFGVNKEGYSSFYLHKDLDGFEISPHTDIISKLVTYLLYLPENDKYKDKLGTYLCVSKDATLEQQSGTHHPWDQFELVKKTEYAPNVFFAFAPNNRSFHGVKAEIDKDEEIQQRNTLRGFVFNKDNDGLPDYL